MSNPPKITVPNMDVRKIGVSQVVDLAQLTLPRWRDMRFVVVVAAIISSGCIGIGIVYAMAMTAGSLPSAVIPLLLAAAVANCIALFAGRLRPLLLAIIIVDIPLQIDANLSYRIEIDMLGGVSGFNVSVTTGCLAALYALWLVQAITSNERSTIPVPKLDMVALLYVAIVALSVLYAQDTLLAAFDLFLLVQMFLLYMYLSSWIQSTGDLLMIVLFLFAALLVEVFLMIVIGAGQEIAIPGIFSGGQQLTSTGRDRLAGTFGSPNYAGSFFAMILGPALGLLFSKAGQRDKWLAGITLGAGSIALLLTFSRGSWLIAMVATGLLCGIAAWRGWLTSKVALAGAVLISTLGLLFGPAVLERLTADDDGAAQSRVPLLHLAQYVIDDYWLLGVGTNNFLEVMPRYLSTGINVQWVYLVHNKYLLVWAETGILGLAAFLLLLFVTVTRGIACTRRGDRLLGPLAAGLCASIIGLIAHMSVESFNGRSLELFWVFAALLLAASRFSAESTPELVVSGHMPTHKVGHGENGRSVQPVPASLLDGRPQTEKNANRRISLNAQPGNDFPHVQSYSLGQTKRRRQ